MKSKPQRKVSVYGAGGFGSEIQALIESHPYYSFEGYIDDFVPEFKKDINEVSNDVLIAISDPETRRKIVKRWEKKQLPFQPFLESHITLHHTVKLGKGTIICQGVRTTVNIQIGEFTIVNINSVIGHDVVIGDFCSLMPCVNIAGNVKIGNKVLIGASATILQGVEVGENAVIGAGALVRENVPAGATVVGVPARQISK